MKFFNNGKTIIHYEDYSSHNNDVICFSNSLGTDNRIWHKILDYFIENFRVITYDKRGHGLSNKPDTKIKIEVENDVDEDAYTGLTPITNREYEQNEQDKKRKIRLVDPSFVEQFVDEFKKLMNETII